MKWWTLVAIGLMACNGDKDDTAATDEADADADADSDTDTDSTATFAKNCAGPQIGSFEGGESGTITGTLQESGYMLVSFETSLGPINSAGQISEDGTVAGGEADVSITGTYDLVGCTGGGTWAASSLEIDGTWQISRDGSE